MLRQTLLPRPAGHAGGAVPPCATGGRAAYPQGMSVRLHLGNYPLPMRPPRWIAAGMAEGLLRRGVPLQGRRWGGTCVWPITA
ncbi:hypothetical protein [Deinococcus radiophilus]|uniref:hypothetical protein n=1 Tax=Deinococcus radiophilus TaxID=32062 RepID=UPI003608449A